MPPLKKTSATSSKKTVAAQAAPAAKPASSQKKSPPVPRRSLLFPLIVLLAFVVGVWAAMPVFFPTKNPDSNNPYAPGTLGYVLSMFSGGQAPDTEFLDGRSADDYLKQAASC